MFYWRAEGERLRNGFNIWRPSDKGSAGFILLLWNYKFNFRWSKNVKRWFICYAKRGTDGYWPQGTYIKGWDE